MAKAAKAIENRIEKMVKPNKPQNKRILKFKSIGYLEKNVHSLIRIEEGVLRSDFRELFSYPIIEVRFTDKIILEGRNKTGKTTFVEALYNKGVAGYYSPDLSIAYFKQNIRNLDDELSILENVMSTSAQDKKTIINLIAKTGIAYEKINCKVKYLSGGEKVKVSLVKVLSCDANLLILDEPTNFLDLVALEAVEEFLNSYKGAFILISHDSYLL
ncbi:ATP-binding cassette domain-containing protein [Streptococcus cuniculi]|nr:ATP-binding cassette domain-containing protein [Streptococcus cuniculi]